MKKISLMLALVVLLGVFAVACGEDDEVLPVAVVTFTLNNPSGACTLTFMPDGTFGLVMTGSNARTFEGSYTSDSSLATMTGITKTSGAEGDGFTSLSSGWTFGYAGGSLATATTPAIFRFNGGANAADQGILITHPKPVEE
ncbi:MAG: hypothetical protein LBC99_03640 [Spirochaetota bacterium]|nr:hypothetical protein [Spirochaetota bacterium]